MGLRVLLVDDSELARKILKKTLSLTDLNLSEVLEASNGSDALEILKSTWVDIVFLDINMPIMNGLEFFKKLKEDPVNHQTPVIVVSTESNTSRLEELRSMGIKGYVKKPFKPEELVKTIDLVLQGYER